MTVRFMQWRAGCAERRMSGSEGGVERRAHRKVDNAPCPYLTCAVKRRDPKWAAMPIYRLPRSGRGQDGKCLVRAGQGFGARLKCTCEGKSHAQEAGLTSYPPMARKTNARKRRELRHPVKCDWGCQEQQRGYGFPIWQCCSTTLVYCEMGSSNGMTSAHSASLREECKDGLR